MLVSVLLPVHAGVAPEHLRQALASVLRQSLPPDEIVVVQDGPLGDDHLTVLDDLERNAGMAVVRVRRPEAGGVAAALRDGTAACRGTWVARMDSDDVATAERLRLQVDHLRTHEVDVLGTAMLTFRRDPTDVVGLRTMPTTHEEIVRRLRSTNALNHPTVLVRRSALEAAGGYQELPGAEDYDLWARMAAAGARFANLEDPLVRFRVGDGLYARRADRTLLRAELTLQRRLVSYGIASRPRAVANLVVRVGFRLLPAPLMRLAYRVVLKERTPPATPTA